MKRKDYIITIKLRSDKGTKPICRVLCGDTIFVSLSEGQTATWTVKRKPKARGR